MKLTDLLYEIGDASAKPLSWSAKKPVGLEAKRFTLQIDRQRDPRDWLGPLKFSYTAQSEKAKYDIAFEASARRRLILMLPGSKPNPGGIKYEMEVWVGFDVNGSDEDTNLNEQYRVMATLIECVKDFVKNVEKYYIIKSIYINPKSDTGSNPNLDSKRGRLYLAYVKKNIGKLPGSWTAYANPDGIEIKNGEWSGGKIVAKS